MHPFITPLLIGLLFISCKNVSRRVDLNEQSLHPKISTEKLDTVKGKSYVVLTKPEIFETSFFEGAKTMTDTDPISFYSVNIGKINSQSGKLIACDPIVMHDAQPFSQTFPVGQFPVQLAIAKIDDDQRVAFSRILFSQNGVKKWEFALQEGEKQIPIDSESLYGYGVDGGIGLFIDKNSNEAFDSLRRKNQNIWTQVFIDEMDKHYRNTWQYVVYNFNEHNLASFSTGYGDGTYSTYVGYDENGNICRLLTDFGLIEWWKK